MIKLSHTTCYSILLFVVISELTGVESTYEIPDVLWDRLADIK